MTDQKTQLVGTWELLSREDVTLEGERRIDPIMRGNPIALLMYDATGHFSAQVMRRDRSSVSAEAPTPSPQTSNNSGAQNGHDAYFGRYAVGADSTVTQELVGALSPRDVGKIVTRRFRIDGNELVIQLETTASHGSAIIRTLRWQRVA